MNASFREQLRHFTTSLQGGEEASGDGNCLELRLRGEPFGDSTSYGLHGRSMLTAVLRVAQDRGWRLAASADVSANRGHDDSGATVDVHSWFFYKDQTPAAEKGGFKSAGGTV